MFYSRTAMRNVCDYLNFDEEKHNLLYYDNQPAGKLSVSLPVVLPADSVHDPQNHSRLYVQRPGHVI